MHFVAKILTILPILKIAFYIFLMGKTIYRVPLCNRKCFFYLSILLVFAFTTPLHFVGHFDEIIGLFFKGK